MSLEELERATNEIIPKDEFRTRLAKAAETGTKLKIKAGFDPTAPDLHLGHTVLLNKLRQFQDLGHQVIFLIGDFTGMIGDPSGKNVTRKPLTQASRSWKTRRPIKNRSSRFWIPTRPPSRSTRTGWIKLGTEDMLKLAAQHTVARMLERDDFQTRYAGKPVRSRCMSSCTRCCRATTRWRWRRTSSWAAPTRSSTCWSAAAFAGAYGQKPQIILTVPILEGLDGVATK
jgi:tyrosyl-tRNA synthetase